LYKHGLIVQASFCYWDTLMIITFWLAATRKSTLVFCVNLAHVRELTSAFRGYGIDARYVYSGTPVAERKALISSFKEGLFPVLINCGQ
jgi:ATP-dependent helicase IRC3